MKFIAYLTKGLHKIVEKEITEKVPCTEINQSSEKYLILGAGESSIEKILDLRTVDDTHILLDFRQFEEERRWRKLSRTSLLKIFLRL